MAFDETIAERVRQVLAGEPGLTERRMFGGIAFMVQGNMCCGILDASLIARVGPDQHSVALARAHARPFDVTGRPMRGFVCVDRAGIAKRAQLESWLAMCLTFARSLPPK